MTDTGTEIPNWIKWLADTPAGECRTVTETIGAKTVTMTRDRRALVEGQSSAMLANSLTGLGQ